MSIHPHAPHRPFTHWKTKLKWREQQLEQYAKPWPRWVREQLLSLRRRLNTRKRHAV